MSHREKENTEEYKKAMQVKEALSVHTETEVIYHFFQRFMHEAFTPKGIRILYTLSLSLFVPSSPQCIVFSSVPLCALLCKNLSLTLHISDAP